MFDPFKTHGTPNPKERRGLAPKLEPCKGGGGGGAVATASERQSFAEGF